MKKIVSICLLVMLGATGCTTAKIYDSANDVPIFMSAPYGVQKYRIVRHVKSDQQICLDYTGAYDVGPIIRKLIKENGGNAMMDVQWKMKATLESGALNVVSLGIARCHVVEVEGDIIKFAHHRALNDSGN